MVEKKNNDVIDLRLIFQKILARKKLFLMVLPVVFVLSCLYIVCIPRSYTSSCRLAPEIGGTGNNSTLGSLMSNLGVDFSQMETSDAITPMLYPDLMEDNKFVTNLFPVVVRKQDGSLTTSYEDYLRHYQQRPFWAYPIGWVKRLFKSKDSGGGDTMGGMEPSPYILSKDDADLCEAIRGNIMLDMDKKTGVITVTVNDQDPLICKTLADSVSQHLQQFIIEYRTNKARVDLDFYRRMASDVKAEYDSMRTKYNAMVDANSNVVMQSYRSRQEDMASELQRIQQKYTTMNGLLDQAVVKVQERTPVFTVLKGADMPVKASKPKRMIFVAGMLILATFCTAGYILKDYLMRGLSMK